MRELTVRYLYIRDCYSSLCGKKWIIHWRQKKTFCTNL